MLRGPRLSPIQAYASIVLDTIELVNRWKRDDRELRLAFLSSGTVEDPADLFDEFKEVVTDDSADIEDEETAVKYVFDNAKMTRSQEEVEREIAEMLAAASSGTNNFETMEFGEWI